MLNLFLNDGKIAEYVIEIFRSSEVAHHYYFGKYIGTEIKYNAISVPPKTKVIYRNF